MRLIQILVMMATFTVTLCDPDLRQLLHVWRPADHTTWHNVTSGCGGDMRAYSNALGTRQQWASAMLDATGHQSNQFLKGNNFWLGSQTQCLQVNEEYLNNEINMTAVYSVIKLKMDLLKPIITPKYADRIFETPPERVILLGICLPGACGDEANIRSLMQQMLQHAKTEQKFRKVETVSVKILPGTLPQLTDTSTILLILLCSTMLILAIIGSVLEFSCNNQEPGMLKSVLLSFSIPRNAGKMFDMSTNVDGSLPALHGFKAIGMVWIILLHVVIFSVFFSENPSFRHIVEKDLLYQALSNGSYSVDTFYFISGILLSYILFRNTANKKRETFAQASGTFIWIVLYRLIRLALPYIFTILISIVSFRYFEALSPFDPSTIDTKVCGTTWWKNLLYINNFAHNSEMCVNWTWYLTVDTQLYIVSAVLLLLYVNGHPRLAMIIGGSLLLSSWLTTATISYSLNYIPSVQQPMVHLNELYIKPWYRVGPFWVGLVTGWILYKDVFKFNTARLIIGWTSCIFGILGVVYVLNWRESFNLTGAATYVALSRTIWALSMAWMLLACVNKKAGWLGSILESPMLAPLGRATYCTYLTHYPLLEWVCLSLEGPLTISRGLVMVIAVGFIGVAYAIGALVSLVFEAPIISLLGLAYKANVKYKAAASQESHNEELACSEKKLQK